MALYAGIDALVESLDPSRLGGGMYAVAPLDEAIGQFVVVALKLSAVCGLSGMHTLKIHGVVRQLISP